MSWDAAIGAGASILGGLLGGKEKTPSQNMTSHLKGVRLGAEKWGFNPLAVLGAVGGPSISPAAPNYMGSAIADAGLILADSMAKKNAEESRVKQLESENAELRQENQNLTLRPKVAGVYAARVATPTLRQGLGVPDADASDPPNRVGPYSGPMHSGSIDPVDPEVRASTETVVSHGQATSLPLGPDFDEVAMGWLVDQNNRIKARRAFENSREAKAGTSQRFAPDWPSQSKTAGQAFRFNPRDNNPEAEKARKAARQKKLLDPMAHDFGAMFR